MQFLQRKCFYINISEIDKFLGGENMSEAIDGISLGNHKINNDELLKLKQKEEPKGEKVGWCNGFNTNQLGGLLNGSLGATSSQG